MSLRLIYSFLLFSLVLSSCDREPIGPDPSGPANYMSIDSLRSLYKGAGDVTVPANADRFRGVVISNSLNEASGNFRLQDNSGAGIYLYLPGAPSYQLGDVLVVDAAGVGVLTLFNGDLELKSVPVTRVKIDSNSTLTVTPRIATIAQIKANVNDWASSLVTINNVTITKNGAPGSTGQNYNIVDSTGSIVSFVRSAANITVPEGGASSITGYVSIFQSTTQLTIRDSSDIKNGGQGGTGGGGSAITLGTSPYLIDFNNLGIALPAGVTVVTGATASSEGTAATFSSSATSSLWNRTSGGFKNYASATGLSQGADSAAQVTSTNRALGVRQTGSTDPGVAFVFLINNTTGKNNLSMEFRLQSLDTSSIVTRTTTWTVDYAIGDNPTSFTQATPTGTLTTGNKVFSNNLITVSLPAALSNQSQKVWIRIVALTPTTGSGNRASTAIDDVKFLWN